MSLKKAGGGLTLATLLVAHEAHAEPPPALGVELGLGWGAELGTLRDQDHNSLGPGLALRVTSALQVPRLAVGGDLVQYAGWQASARDSTGLRAYRAAYRTTQAGVSVGWDFGTKVFVVRPSVGAGARVSFGRTSLANTARVDDAVTACWTASTVFAVRHRSSWFGVDLKFLYAPHDPLRDAGVGSFAVIGFER